MRYKRWLRRVTGALVLLTFRAKIEEYLPAEDGDFAKIYRRFQLWLVGVLRVYGIDFSKAHAIIRSLTIRMLNVQHLKAGD